MKMGHDQKLFNAVCKFNEKSAQSEIYQGARVYKLLFHEVLQSVPRSHILRATARRQIVYILRNAGLDVNAQDEVGNTVLHLVLLHVDGDPELVEPLLQAGADVTLPNQNGDSCEKLLDDLPHMSSATRELFNKYKPGLWSAVAADDLASVRKLVNLWCRVDISKDEKTLRQLTFEIGTEHIINLIKFIEPSMHVAHSVLAGDTEAVRKLCAADDKNINLHFRNMGDMGATPLFYAIMQNNVQMIDILMNYKQPAKIDTTITFQDEDIPIYFVALNKECDPEVIRLLTPRRCKAFLNLHYRGNNVLFHCIENTVHPSAVRYILQQGYPELVAARNKHNETGREVAFRQGLSQYVRLLDETVHDWYLDPDPANRKALALLGYTGMRDAQKDGVRVCEVVESMETSSDQAKFDTQLHAYQSQVQQLVRAIERGDAGCVKSLVAYNGPNAECFHRCLAVARQKGDGQPLIIKSILHSQMAVSEVLCDAITQLPGVCVDMERDAWYRTALHYAYGMQGSRKAVNMLMQFGCSEFTMDKDERSPLVFRDFQNAPEMHDLIRYHITQTYEHPEPNPWKKKPKIHLAQCQNHSHSATEPVVTKPETPAKQPASYWAYCAIL